jgi:hypothetical protein
VLLDCSARPPPQTQLPIPPPYTNTYTGGTNTIDWAIVYSNNLASVSEWLHDGVTNADGTPTDSMQDYADFAATAFSGSGAFSWQQSAMDEALTWATANGIPLSFTNGTLNSWFRVKTTFQITFRLATQPERSRSTPRTSGPVAAAVSR